jgi:hypothetical protein
VRINCLDKLRIVGWPPHRINVIVPKCRCGVDSRDIAVTYSQLRLEKQGSLLIGERIVETAPQEKLVGRGDNDEFNDSQVGRPLNTKVNQPTTDSPALHLNLDGQTLHFRHLSGIDLNRNEPDDSLLEFGDEPVAS